MKNNVDAVEFARRVRDMGVSFDEAIAGLRHSELRMRQVLPAIHFSELPPRPEPKPTPWWQRHEIDLGLVVVGIVQTVAITTTWLAWGPAAGLVAWFWFMLLWLRPWRY